jgi:hypothetical protein
MKKLLTTPRHGEDVLSRPDFGCSGPSGSARAVYVCGEGLLRDAD